MLRSDRRSGIIQVEQSQQIAGVRRYSGVDPITNARRLRPARPVTAPPPKPTPAIPVTPRVRMPARRPAKGVALFPFRRDGAHEARSR